MKETEEESLSGIECLMQLVAITAVIIVISLILWYFTGSVLIAVIAAIVVLLMANFIVAKRPKTLL